MLRNLEPNTSKELLSMYLERLCGSVPHSIETNHDKSMVMASCRHKLGEIVICSLFRSITYMINICGCMYQAKELC